jgi:MFS family permease
MLGVISFALITLAPINQAFLLILLFFISGAACAGQALSFSLVSRNNKLEHHATAIGFNNMAVVISGFIFQPLIGYIIRISQSTPVTDYLYDGNSYHKGMLVVLSGYIIATITVIFFIRGKTSIT